MIGRRNLVIDAGEDYEASFVWLAADGQPHNLASAVLVAQIRSRYFDLADPGGEPISFDVSGAADGTVLLRLTAEQTDAIPPGVYVWDCVIETGGTIKRVSGGAATIRPAVTGFNES